jgi:hypothetical protein
MGETRLYRINHLPKMNRAQFAHSPLNHDRSLNRTPLNMKKTGRPAFYCWTHLSAFVIHSPVVTTIGGVFVIDMVVI